MRVSRRTVLRGLGLAGLGAAAAGCGAGGGSGGDGTARVAVVSIGALIASTILAARVLAPMRQVVGGCTTTCERRSCISATRGSSGPAGALGAGVAAVGAGAVTPEPERRTRGWPAVDVVAVAAAPGSVIGS